jgi:transposase
VAELCKDFDVGDTAVRRWIQQTRDGRLGGDARLPNVAQSEEIEALRKENLTLRMERDILKRAMAFFAKETR